MTGNEADTSYRAVSVCEHERNDAQCNDGGWGMKDRVVDGVRVESQDLACSGGELDRERWMMTRETEERMRVIFLYAL